MFSPDDRMMPGYMARPMMAVDRRWKPTVELAPNCPRCNSSNTKFCYYNNYSLTQPRYFCKGCRRYWTKGGSLRNVPVGGGCRKNRRSKAVRLSGDSMTARNVGCERRPPTVEPLRPDLALDDMVGSSRQSIGSGSVLSSSDGSSIDLALLYARFLNQCPALEPGVVDEAAFDLVGPMGSSHPVPGQVPDQVGPSPGSVEPVMGEFGFGLDPCGGYEPLAIPVAPDVVGGRTGGMFLSNIDESFPNLGWEVAPDNDRRGLHGGMEGSMGHHHHQDLVIGDWCTLDQSSFEAF